MPTLFTYYHTLLNHTTHNHTQESFLHSHSGFFSITRTSRHTSQTHSDSLHDIWQAKNFWIVSTETDLLLAYIRSRGSWDCIRFMGNNVFTPTLPKLWENWTKKTNRLQEDYGTMCNSGKTNNIKQAHRDNYPSLSIKKIIICNWRELFSKWYHHKTRDKMLEYLETISKDLLYQNTSFYDKKLDVKPHEL